MSIAYADAVKKGNKPDSSAAPAPAPAPVPAPAKAAAVPNSGAAKRQQAKTTAQAPAPAATKSAAATPAPPSFADLAKAPPKPKVKPTSSSEKLKFCQSLVGYHVEFSATLPPGSTQKLRGIVYAAHADMLVLQESSGLRLINMQCIKSKPTKINGAKKVISELEVVSELDAAQQQVLRERFELATARRERLLANRNMDASAFAQRMFDDLQKTFVCTWDGTTIFIEDLGNLRIPAPYTAQVVTGNEDRAVERVKKIIEHMKRSELEASSP